MNNTKSFLYNLATDKKRGLLCAVIKSFLFILSLIYAAAVEILIFFSRLSALRLECKVISVGNITLGGTGKTSLVEYIARRLKEQGRQVAILSRGYKKNKISPQSSALSLQPMGDEPYMLQSKLKDVPVIVNVDRAKAARGVIKDYGADTVILDDGFQQWRLIKDLEIVTIDAVNPFGNRHLLPRGTLREPLSSLKRADIFILTKTSLAKDTGELKRSLNRINPQAVIFESVHRPLGFYTLNNAGKLQGSDILKGRTVTLFSGIGDPDSFEKLVNSLGINIGLSFKFADHYNYSSKDLENIFNESKKKNINTAVTTEKDAARLSQRLKLNLKLSTYVLPIKLEIKDEQGFSDRLLKLYSF